MFLIAGCARSGTTSLASILNRASNALCLIEPTPDLNRESRNFMEGRLSDPRDTVRNTVLKRAAEEERNGRIYGEKAVTLALFVPYLTELAECRFILVKRDGRDVVRSLIDWHNRMFGSIYRECKDPGNLSARAKAAVAALPIEEDSSDYARPRPRPGDIWYERWEDFSRLEMCAWYWSRINDLHLDQFAGLRDDQWTEIDYTAPTAEDIMRVADYIGLDGLSVHGVREHLEARVNSLKQRTGEDEDFARWPDWRPIDRVQFENVAARTMQRLGYYPLSGFVRYRPPNYGEWWKQNEGGLEWYEWMYSERKSAHENLLAFVARVEQREGAIGALLDVGCGRGVGYSDAFADRRYVGMDLSEKEIVWCRENRKNGRHDYIVGDTIQAPPKERFDVVFSQGTIDNSYDMDAYLRAMVACSRGWIYATAYRGWFPEIPEHRYTWDEATTCFYNDISPSQARRTLEELGCRDIEIGPLPMPGRAIPNETRIVARVADRRIG